jgi:amidohydrolase
MTDTSSPQATLSAWYRQFHQHPEPSGQETQTTATIRGLLGRLGVSVIETGLPTGVIAKIPGRHAGAPTVALRADIDALPIVEATGLPYASTQPGAHHACGHDFHTTVLLGAATRLRDNPADGDVILIFQPAEETAQGAQQVVATGSLTAHGVQAVFGIHVRANLPVGAIAVKPGPMSAAVDRFTIRLSGHGAHAAAPHLAHDVIVTTGQLIGALQTPISRGTDPFAPAVLSVTRIHSGTTWNVLPETAELEGTIRSFDSATRADVKAGLERITAGVAAANQAEAHVDWVEGPDAVDNDARLAALIRDTAQRAGIAVQEPTPSAGGEDFAAYQTVAPTGFFLVGVDSPAPIHTSGFRPDESGLSRYADLYADIARVYRP